MNIYAIIVTYNGKKWYDKCLGSLRASTQAIIPIIIDNASTDGSVDYIRTNYPEAYIIPNNENLGFAKANNYGMKYALDNGADYVFLLNQDAWVEKNTISELLRTFRDNANVGIASPIHLNGSYSGLDCHFPYYAGGEFTSDAYMGHLKHYYLTEFVNAAAWMISADCIRKVGGFDTSLFKHYGEDDNYAQRVKYHGFSIIINTQCTICHDREKRVFDTTKFNPDQQEKSEKISKGDITQNFDIRGIIAKKKKELYKAYIGIHPKKVRRLKRELELLNIIKISRELNAKGGMVWLNNHTEIQIYANHK